MRGVIFGLLLSTAVFSQPLNMQTQGFPQPPNMQTQPPNTQMIEPPLKLKEEDLQIIRLRKKLLEKELQRDTERIDKELRREKLEHDIEIEELKLAAMLLNRKKALLKIKPLFEYEVEVSGVVGNVVLFKDGPAVKTPVILHTGDKLEVKNGVAIIGRQSLVPIKVVEAEIKIDSGSAGREGRPMARPPFQPFSPLSPPPSPSLEPIPLPPPPPPGR